MGFLKKSKVPSELPDLAIGSMEKVQPSTSATPPLPTPTQPATTQQTAPTLPPSTHTTPMPPTPINNTTDTVSQASDIPGPEKDYSTEDSNPLSEEQQEIKKHLHEGLEKEEDPESFIDTMLQDINGEMKDVGRLEAWYNNTFLPQDVVSNMKDYWEDNKAGMIIRSFGSEYKERINKHGRKLQELEGDWREIYFKLIKKEEEMKKEERILKETLSEFVELCKRRKLDSDGKDNQESQEQQGDSA